GGQASVSLIGIYGRSSVPSLRGTLAGVLATPFGTIPFTRSDNFSDSVWGFGDLIPQASLRWNNGAHNSMTYITGDVPAGAYDPTACLISASGTARSTLAVATPISIRRLGMNSPACSASPITSRTSRPNTRTASTCISIGPHRSS